MTHETESITCAQYGDTCAPAEMSEVQVELEDGTKTIILLCDRICYPDFWDDVAPGEFTRCDAADIEVRKLLWTCEECTTVGEYGLFKLVLDTEWEPPSEAIICSFCRKKEKDRWIEK